MDENRKGDLLTILLFAVIVALIVGLVIIMAPYEVTKKQRKEMIYNRVLGIVDSSGFSYNLTTPEYSDTYCKPLTCLYEQDWNTVNTSLQELFDYINQTTQNTSLYLLRIDEFIMHSWGGGDITNDIIRIGVIRTTFEGKQVFDGIDIDY